MTENNLSVIIYVFFVQNVTYFEGSQLITPCLISSMTVHWIIITKVLNIVTLQWLYDFFLNLISMNSLSQL